MFHCARDSRHYVELALALARDAAARRSAGEINRAFVRDFLSDRMKMAGVVGRHFVELIRTPRPR
jgi:hypothetical protein